MILTTLTLTVVLYTIVVHGHSTSFCQLQNRTVTLNICRTPPQLILPVCVGFCSSQTQWDVRSNRFFTRLNACTVSNFRTEQFVCPDATHTAIDLVIPTSCSCSRYSCSNSNLHSTRTKSFFPW